MYGQIAVINEREVTTKRGKSTAYGVKLALEDGTESGWIGLGFKKPDAARGDWVKLEVYKNQGGYDTADSVEKAQPPVKQASAAVGTGNRAPAKSGGYVDRNDSIVYQSSRKDAIAVLGLLIEQNALPISGAKTAAGVAKRFDEIKALVDKLTVEFYYDVQSLRVLEEVEDAGSVEPDDAGALPSEDAEEGDGSDNWADGE